MPENKKECIDEDISDLLSISYKEVDIDDDFRVKLQGRTRNAVTAPRPYNPAKWIAGLGIGTALATVIVIALLHTYSAPTSPQKRQIAKAETMGSIDRNHPGISHNVPVVSAPKVRLSDHQRHLVNRGTASLPVNDEGTNVASDNLKPAPAVHYGDPVAVVVAAASNATRTVGCRVRSGEPVITDRDSILTLVTPKGSELILDEKSELVLNSDGTAALKSGRLLCRNRDHEIRVIGTPGGNIQLLGTALNAAIKGKDSVAVTVVDGKVKLSNAHGNAILESGKRSLLMANRTPEKGTPVNTALETAWYDGRGKVVSDFGEIAYTVYRPGSHIMEIWVMNSDGKGKHRIKSYIGGASQGEWLPAAQWLTVGYSGKGWGMLDIAKHTAIYDSGSHPILSMDDTHLFLLNAVNCADVPITLPHGYSLDRMALSPNGRYIALFGPRQTGLWLYDTETGAMRSLIKGDMQTTQLAWSPNSQYVVVSEKVQSGTYCPVSMVDVRTGGVTKLNVQGAGAADSPDRKRTGAFDSARRIIPKGHSAMDPSWSPDGSRLLYSTSGQPEKRDGGVQVDTHVYVVHSDGSGLKEIYDCNGFVSASWSADGRSVYIRKPNSLMQVAADGSGIIADLGGKAEDSPLSPDEAAQTSQASADIEEAIYQFGLGMVRMVQAIPAESKAAFKASSEIFASLPWKYPLAGLSVNNCTLYADTAEGLATKSGEAVLADSCIWRMRLCSFHLSDYSKDIKTLPPSLDTVEDWAVNSTRPLDDWVTGNDGLGWTKLLFSCPGSKDSGPVPFIYRESAAVGEVILTCPNHPKNSIKMEEWMR